MFQVNINNSNYTEWSYSSDNSDIPLDINQLNPLTNKLFNGDQISFNGDQIKIESSETRSAELLGVLILETFQTFGKINNKQLYKVIPRDLRLPEFLVPYEIKKSDMGFSKNLSNKYVIFKYMNWDNKHPIGQIIETIGCITELSSFYRYELVHYKLNISISNFNKEVNKIKTIDFNDIQIKYNLEIRDTFKVFSIDPSDCTDFDDAFSIQSFDSNKYLISIYISNVPILLNYLNLWNYMTDRISTIYLPNNKLPMLPSGLSDNYCSLKKGEYRVALCLDMLVDGNTGVIIDSSLKNVLIKLKYNFVYDTNELLSYCNYQKLFNVVKIMCPSISDSHELVEKLMIIMNNYCGKILLESNKGIFRATVQNQNQNTLPEKIKNELLLSNFSGIYTIDYTNTTHNNLETTTYVHITSPIRRMVDVLNMSLIVDLQPEFYNNWINKIELINENTKKIKKIQSQSYLLNLLTTNTQDIYEGYVIDYDNSNQSYNIYVPLLKLYTKIKNCNLNLYEKYKFKFYVFENENKFNKKIKVDLLNC